MPGTLRCQSRAQAMQRTASVQFTVSGYLIESLGLPAVVVEADACDG